MSKKASTKKPTARKATVTHEPQGTEAVDPCCGMAPTPLDSMDDYDRGFKCGHECALHDSFEPRLKRLRDRLAALTEAVAETSDRLKLFEVERDNCANAIQRIGTSLGF